MAEEKKTTKLVIPPEDPHNIQATKYYIFNETGNIMMASTDDTSSDIQQSVRDVFAEVSVFFAAMTRAITTTNNPRTDKPYSIYNYTALEKIIGGSGLFAWVTQEDIEHTTESFGMEFSKELLEGLLGLATGTGAMSFAQGMLASIGQEGLRISKDSEDTTSSVANIVFVCEYLLGMPSVSVIVVYANVSENKDSISIGPCFNAEKQESHWIMHKDTYLFVTPQFIRRFSSDMESAISSTEFAEFVEFLRSLLTDKPFVSGVKDSDGNDAPSKLMPGDSYSITGNNLEDTVSIKLGDAEVLNIGEVTDTIVGFNVKGDAPDNTEIAPISLLNSSNQLLKKTPDSYGIAKKSTSANATGGKKKTN